MLLRSIVLATSCIALLAVASSNAANAQATEGDGMANEQELMTDADEQDYSGIAADGTDELDDIFAGIDDTEPAAADDTTEAMAEEAAADEEQPVRFPPGPEAATAADGESETHALRERVAALRTEVEELRNMVNSLQRALARAQDLSDFSSKALGAMTEDADLRSTMGKMLQGKIRLTNNTGQEQVRYINGTPWTVVTGASYVFAPVGRVSFSDDPVDAPTFKDTQDWSVNEETGEMELEYTLGTSDTANEQSVLKPLPQR